jgi:hypothetical protein
MGRVYQRDSQIMPPLNFDPQTASPEQMQRAKLQMLEHNIRVLDIPIAFEVLTFLDEDQIKHVQEIEHPFNIEDFPQISPWQLPGGLILDGIVIESMRELSEEEVKELEATAQTGGSQ